MSYYLLLGAGFSKNWGGLLASEVFNDLLSADELDEFTRNLLYRANEPKGGGFEAVLAKLQGATDAENVKRYNTLISVLAGIFNAMGQAYMQRQFEFSGQPDAQRSITPFLGRFTTIFTTNQDTLLEQKYIPASNIQRPAHLPGVKFTNPGVMQGSIYDRIAIMEPNPSEFRLSPQMQPVIKLHGSVNWVESNVGQRILIMGGAKSALIKRYSLLTWYHEEFRKALTQPNARLMVMGYSFSDEYLNEVILDAAKNHQLKIFIVDPAGVAIIDKRDKSASIPQPIEELQECLEKRLIGISTRYISSAFNDDTVENARLFRFFDQ
jgi:hypothetical protein